MFAVARKTLKKRRRPQPTETKKMNTVYLSLGSNEGDRLRWLDRAIHMLGEKVGIIFKQSSIYQTAAWGITDQPDFLNMAIEVRTDLSAEKVLDLILEIETSLGRHREMKWGPRTLDIDILLYNEAIIATENLVVPHPYLQDRLFTLKPLAEIAGDHIHPKFHKNISQLLGECPDTLPVTKYEP